MNQISAVSTMAVMWQRRFRQILRDQLPRTRAAQPEFSLRELAKRYEMSSGALSELISGKRALTLKSAGKLLPKMNLTDGERQDLNQLMSVAPIDRQELSQTEIVELICNRIYGSILASLQLDDAPSDLPTLAHQLGLLQEDVSRAWQRLTVLGLIAKGSDGTFLPVKELPRVNRGEERDLARQLRERVIVQSSKALQSASLDKIKACTHVFSGSTAQIDAMVAETERFAKRMPSVAQGDVVDEVYQMNVQIVPLKA